MSKHYLDYNATAPVRPEVILRMAEIMEHPANASSVHGAGRAARATLEAAREHIAQAISCFPNEVIFTGSGTEANNLALRGFVGRTILVSTIEHASVLKAAPNMQIIPVTEDGIVDLAVLDALLSIHSPALVSVMLANNETGVIQPIAEISALTRRHGALLHTDAVQALGKIPVDFTLLGADMMTLSAHKFGGPQGAAALILRNDVPIISQLTGGRQELGRRAGTENIAAIAGFAVAVELMETQATTARLTAYRDRLEATLLQAAPDARIAGKTAHRLPNTTCVTLPGISSETQLMSLDLAGIATSAGSACSSGRVEPSHVLLAMGYNAADAAQTIRISSGWATTDADIDALVTAWGKLAHKRTSAKAA